MQYSIGGENLCAEGYYFATTIEAFFVYFCEFRMLFIFWKHGEAHGSRSHAS